MSVRVLVCTAVALALHVSMGVQNARAQSAAAGAGRTITANDFAGGSVFSSFKDSKPNGAGLEEVTQRIDFPTPMAGVPAIMLSVTRISVDGKPGHLGYSVGASQPTCVKSASAELTCSGFDLTMTADKGAKISQINVEWVAMNVLVPGVLSARPSTPVRVP